MAKKIIPQSPVSDAPQKPQVAEGGSQVQDLQSRLARALADYANLEKRFGRESGAVIKFANSGILQKLLTIRDHIEMAATSLKDPALTMILSAIDKLLVDEDVVEIRAAGQFDPSTMECHEQVSGEKDQILSVAQRGYKLHDRVLRPARVTVGNGQPSGSDPGILKSN